MVDTTRQNRNIEKRHTYTAMFMQCYSICEDYITMIFMYTISTVHNPDRQNYI